MVVDGRKILFECFLLELPWRNNQPRISCIPLGKYKAVKRPPGHEGSRFKYWHFEVLNVPGRTKIKWHVANYVKELLGCGAPGSKVMDIDADGKLDAANSRNTLKKLVAILPDEFELIITQDEP